jgi:hypothetical protein
MFKISKIALVAAVTGAGLASPALAQSFDPDAGTGNVISFGYGLRIPQNAPMAARHAAPTNVARQRSALGAFAMVPAISSDGNLLDPALTGGGSPGYNENLRREF